MAASFVTGMMANLKSVFPQLSTEDLLDRLQGIAIKSGTQCDPSQNDGRGHIIFDEPNHRESLLYLR
jgi:hypothetical protein